MLHGGRGQDHPRGRFNGEACMIPTALHWLIQGGSIFWLHKHEPPVITLEISFNQVVVLFRDPRQWTLQNLITDEFLVVQNI